MRRPAALILAALALFSGAAAHATPPDPSQDAAFQGQTPRAPIPVPSISNPPSDDPKVLGSPASEPPGAEPSPARRALNASVALVPGLAVHGAGHMAAGDVDTGLSLLAVEGLGILLTLGGIGGLAATGASPRLSTPFIASTISGVGLFGLSALADIYGVLAPTGGFGRPDLDPPPLQLQAGYRHVLDPTFDYRNFAHARASARLGKLRLSPEAWIALDDANWRLIFMSAWRLVGPTGADHIDLDGIDSPGDGTALDLELGLVHHRYDTEGFSITTGEVAVQGRLDLARLAPTLQGAFAEMGFGLAMGANSYDGLITEATDLLLGRFAFGLYLGDEGQGELSIYYDHRHDGYAAGLKAKGLGSGAAGHFGARLATRVHGPWGVELSAEAGSAIVTGASITLELGGKPR